MKIVAFMPIKLNSQRLPCKNIKPLNGRPMLNYAIDTVNSLNSIDNYIFCSDPKVMDYVESSNVEFLQRDTSLDSDNTLGSEIYDAFIKQIDADAYILYHATSPLLEKKYYEQGIHSINMGMSSAFTVFRHQTFAWYRRMPLNFDIEIHPRTQDLNPIMTETSGFYMFRKEIWDWHKRRIGPSPDLVEVDFWSSVDIDYQWQFDLCERKLKNV